MKIGNTYFEPITDEEYREWKAEQAVLEALEREEAKARAAAWKAGAALREAEARKKRETALARAKARKERAKAKLEWQAGIRLILDECRRRESARKPRFRVAAIVRPLNPLDGARLWDNS